MPAPTLSCTNQEVYVTDRSLPPLMVIDEYLGTSISTTATNVRAEPSTISQGVDHIGRHVEVRVEASNNDSLTSTCAFQANIKGE